MKILKNIFLSIFLFAFTQVSYSEMTTEDIIKGRKSIFSDNKKTARQVRSLVNDIEFEDAKKLMIQMSENYKALLEYFPDNSKKGFRTEALPSIWENKSDFNALMNKASNDMIQLANIIEDSNDLGSDLQKYMWSNCKACHTKYRTPH